ncbi:MAG: hypothetical protein JWO52_4574 [Gammaproteobacteria bacterium]|nr:hypothetical protein [Gammaproteobacteria bacterium]
MPDVRCLVADLNLATGAPHITNLLLAQRGAGDYFVDGSGPAAVRVVFDWSRRGLFPGLVSLNGVNDFHLNQALPKLLGSAAPQAPARIGLFLADLYQPAPDQYGLMFDFAPVPGYFGPRQGCAVFLTALQLNSDPTSFADFLAFTAIHELGHTFNLWHTDGPGFLQPHPQATHLDPKAFDPLQQAYLADATDPTLSRYVMPGQSAFGERPAGWPHGDGTPFAGADRIERGLTLTIGLSHTHFWSYEPVELDIRLALKAGRKRAVSVPNELDPGYSSFIIWITTPDGERFRFRPERRFCRHNGERVIHTGTPFQRDISIFKHAGGYTFRQPGRYTLQVSFQIRPDRTLWSNTMECEVLPAAPDSKPWAQLRSTLAMPAAGTLLRYKQGVLPRNVHDQVIQLATGRHTPPATAAALHYSLGVALARERDRPRAKRDRPQLERSGRKQLQAALTLNSLSRHRRRIAEQLLNELSQRRD